MLELHRRLIQQSGGMTGLHDEGFSLIQNHHYVDGNKRISHGAMETTEFVLIPLVLGTPPRIPRLAQVVFSRSPLLQGALLRSYTLRSGAAYTVDYRLRAGSRDTINSSFMAGIASGRRERFLASETNASRTIYLVLLVTQ